MSNNPGITIQSFSNQNQNAISLANTNNTTTTTNAIASTSNPSAPLKLTFRLGGSSTTASAATTGSTAITSSTAPSSIAAESEIDIDSQSEAGSSVVGAPSSHGGGYNGGGENPYKGDRGLDDGRAPMNWDNRGKLPVGNAPKPKGRRPKASTGTATPGIIGENGEEKPKQKRKRAPKRPPGEVGPGKSWRKGLKGNLAGTGAPPRVITPNSNPYAYKPQASPSASTSASTSTAPAVPRAFPVGPTPKIAANYIPPQPLEVGTPRPRSWKKVVKELTSVTGSILKFKSWQGNPSSAYYDATHIAPIPSTNPLSISLQQSQTTQPSSPALSDYSPLPLTIAPSALSQIPLSQSYNPIIPLQFSLSSNPVLPPLPPSFVPSLPSSSTSINPQVISDASFPATIGGEVERIRIVSGGSLV